VGTKKVTVSLPDEIVAQLNSGDIDLSSYVTDAVRRELVRDGVSQLLAALEADGSPPVTADELAEFCRLVGEDFPPQAAA
jgi:hypothetical protein